jgi:ubiquinone/menaquinone biosynthesis C-methylase UbiE
MPLAADAAADPRLIAAYDRAAPAWPDKSLRFGYPAAYRWLLAQSLEAGPPPAHVLDVGCGTGAFAEASLDALAGSRSLTLADPSEAMLRIARDRLGARIALVLVRAPLRFLSAATAYDLILCAHVLDHGRDPAGDLAHLARLLAPSGCIVLVHSRPHWCSRLVALRWRHRPRAPAAIRAAIQDAGLRLVADHRFPSGPPRRLSHGYVITQGEPS